MYSDGAGARADLGVSLFFFDMMRGRTVARLPNPDAGKRWDHNQDGTRTPGWARLRAGGVAGAPTMKSDELVGGPLVYVHGGAYAIPDAAAAAHPHRVHPLGSLSLVGAALLGSTSVDPCVSSSILVFAGQALARAAQQMDVEESDRDAALPSGSSRTGVGAEGGTRRFQGGRFASPNVQK